MPAPPGGGLFLPQENSCGAPKKVTSTFSLNAIAQFLFTELYYCIEPPTMSRISLVIFCWRFLLYSRVSV